jgi:hypothetical protein
LAAEEIRHRQAAARARSVMIGFMSPTGHLGIDRIALPAPAAGVRVRLVYLEDPDAVLAQVAHERSGI